MVGLSGGKQSADSKSNSYVWDQQTPYLTNLYQSAQDLYNNQDIFGAGQEALGSVMPQAMSGYNQLFDPNRNNLEGSAGMNWLQNTLGANPNLEGAIDATQQGIYDNMQRYGLPQDRTNAQMAGQARSSRQGIAEGLRMAEADKNAANIGSQMRQQDMARQQNAANSMNSSLLSQYGLQNQGYLGGLNAMSGLMQNSLAPYMAQLQQLGAYTNAIGSPTRLSDSQSSSSGWNMAGDFGKMFGASSAPTS